jgi:hypothetical protein
MTFEKIASLEDVLVCGTKSQLSIAGKWVPPSFKLIGMLNSAKIRLFLRLGAARTSKRGGKRYPGRDRWLALLVVGPAVQIRGLAYKMRLQNAVCFLHRLAD